MATTIEYIEYVCEQINGTGIITYKKMFGEYLIYVNDKPIILVCDNIPYVKKHETIEDKMSNADCGFPYNGAKEHYILDIDDVSFSKEIVDELEKVIPIPKKRVKKKA